jgi:hypothetical protein
MAACKHKKRLQLYLDGWMEPPEAGRFERHLKKCSECQAELMALEEVSSSALEIVDEAPDSGYWNSFYPRILNRIISRDVTPYERPEKSQKSFRLRMGVYSLVVVSLAAALLLAVNIIPDILNSTSDQQVKINSAAQKIETPTDESNDRIENSSTRAEYSDANGPNSPSDMQTPAIFSEAEPAPSDRVSADSNGDKAPVGLANDDTEFESYFRDGVSAADPKLELSNSNSYSGNAIKTDYDKIDKDYRLSSSMISAGILSDFDNKGKLPGIGGDQFGLSAFDDGGRDILDGSMGDWGYLSMPADSVDTLEIRRFLLELELIQTK